MKKLLLFLSMFVFIGTSPVCPLNKQKQDTEALYFFNKKMLSFARQVAPDLTTLKS